MITEGPAGYYVATLSGTYTDVTEGGPVTASLSVDATFYADKSSNATPIADRIANTLSCEKPGLSIHLMLSRLQPQPIQPDPALVAKGDGVSTR